MGGNLKLQLAFETGWFQLRLLGPLCSLELLIVSWAHSLVVLEGMWQGQACMWGQKKWQQEEE